ncbi:MAG: response regulator [Candidatus Marinimicrobia bacterium]|nr:response regulator [Candidatus Neomarinimicrobiota bacterium]
MKQNILLVDDDTAVLELLKDFLVDKEFNVITAKNGEDALGKYGDNFNGIVISDLDMPVMDGIELLKRLKKKDTDCIGIILTGHGTMETCTKSLGYRVACW